MYYMCHLHLEDHGMVVVQYHYLRVKTKTLGIAKAASRLDIYWYPNAHFHLNIVNA